MSLETKRKNPIRRVSSHLYTWVERDTVRIKCLIAQEHNTMILARAPTVTAQSSGEGTNQLAST